MVISAIRHLWSSPLGTCLHLCLDSVWGLIGKRLSPDNWVSSFPRWQANTTAASLLWYSGAWDWFWSSPADLPSSTLSRTYWPFPGTRMWLERKTMALSAMVQNGNGRKWQRHRKQGERFSYTNKPREEQTSKTKVKPEKAATGLRGECGQGRGLCQSSRARVLGACGTLVTKSTGAPEVWGSRRPTKKPKKILTSGV